MSVEPLKTNKPLASCDTVQRQEREILRRSAKQYCFSWQYIRYRQGQNGTTDEFALEKGNNLKRDGLLFSVGRNFSLLAQKLVHFTLPSLQRSL
jgi:hypothetical protein